MDNSSNIETFFLINKKKISINVHNKHNSKNIFFDERDNKINHNEFDFDLLRFFLEKNIFKIEKLTNSFVKNINLIIESDQFTTIQVSIKKDNNGNILKRSDLTHMLNEAQHDCKNSILKNKIIHMIIDNYVIDGKKFPFFPNNFKCKYISIDLRLICLSSSFINEIEKILKYYQITIRRVLNFNYIESYLDNKKDLFKIASKIMGGLNENEVIIVPKKTNIKGFFERFFNFFS